jgi:hypothetical protein
MRKADPALRSAPAKLQPEGKARHLVRDEARIFIGEVTAKAYERGAGKGNGSQPAVAVPRIHVQRTPIGSLAFPATAAARYQLNGEGRLGDVSSLPCIQDPEAMGGFFAV